VLEVQNTNVGFSSFGVQIKETGGGGFSSRGTGHAHGAQFNRSTDHIGRVQFDRRAEQVNEFSSIGGENK
jgi:hypothetical protein